MSTALRVRSAPARPPHQYADGRRRALERRQPALIRAGRLAGRADGGEPSRLVDAADESAYCRRVTRVAFGRRRARARPTAGRRRERAERRRERDPRPRTSRGGMDRASCGDHASAASSWSPDGRRISSSPTARARSATSRRRPIPARRSSTPITENVPGRDEGRRGRRRRGRRTLGVGRRLRRRDGAGSTRDISSPSAPRPISRRRTTSLGRHRRRRAEGAARRSRGQVLEHHRRCRRRSRRPTASGSRS